MVTDLLVALAPDEFAFSRLFRAHVDDAALRVIAEADYGWGADECFALLVPLRDGGGLPAESFQLQEVLELTRWWEPGEAGGHWTRLFACAALVRVAAIPEWAPYISSENATFIQLIDSAMALGRDVCRFAASLLAWRFLKAPPQDEDRPFLAFGILLLAAYLERSEEKGPWLRELAEWVEAEEERWRPHAAWEGWLLGLTFHDLRHSAWRAAARRILLEPAQPHPAAADEELRLLGELVQLSPG